MKALIVCKASTTTGLGHLVRARTFAEKVMLSHFDIELHFVMIGDRNLRKLITALHCKFEFFEGEEEFQATVPDADVAFFDSIDFSKQFVGAVRSRCKLAVSLSPVFNQMDQMDLMISRTKYFNTHASANNLKIYGGLQYTLVQPDCYKIDTNYFVSNFAKSSFHVAVSMGGGDAPNKSLQIVNILKDLAVPATIWVMLGEGYKHSYDKFIEAVEKDSQHEIILAKTNKSLWSILNNCSLLITTSGVTSYEAVYAGLPSITYYDLESQYYLIRELVEGNVSISGGLFNPDNLSRLNSIVYDLYNNKRRLIEMHKKAIHLIDGNAHLKIMQIVKDELRDGKRTGEFPYISSYNEHDTPLA